MQKTKVCLCWQMLYTVTWICRRKNDSQNSLTVCDIDRPSKPDQRSKPSNQQKMSSKSKRKEKGINCSKLAQKEYSPRHDCEGEGDPLGIGKELSIWLYKQMAYAQPRIRPGKWVTQNSLGFWNTNGSSNLGQTTKPSDFQFLPTSG